VAAAGGVALMKGGTFMFCRWFAACCVLPGMGLPLPVDEPAAGAAGREHHHRVFSPWLAGGGVRGGMTWRHAGRDYRLTDVHGEVVAGILS
jgi:hypothetical protein